MTELVDGPGWVDHSFVPNRGLFPIGVERYLNSAVALHAPGVTTVTVSARYYALHAMVAFHARERDLGPEQARALLRRGEVVFALANIAHEKSDDHPFDTPSAHGADYLRPKYESGAVDLDAAAAIANSGTYAKASWGFWGAYRGSEMTLKIMGTSGFVPGSEYDDDAVTRALGSVIELAKADRPITPADVTGLDALCLCWTSVGADADWLARRFAGDATAGRMAGVLGNTMNLIKAAIVEADITSVDDVQRYIMYSPNIADATRDLNDVWLRWRGLTLRSLMVDAWRRFWADLCAQLDHGGAVEMRDLRKWAAEMTPGGSVREFQNSLPQSRDAAGNVMDAERTASVFATSSVERYLGTLVLSASRTAELSESELLGYQGNPNDSAYYEELSPNWMTTIVTDWADRPLKDLASHLVDVMLARSQRLALMKSRFNPRTGRFVFPARVHVRDELVFKVFNETARPPSLRLAQLMSMSRQVGLLKRDDTGRWQLGPRAHFYG